MKLDSQIIKLRQMLNLVVENILYLPVGKYDADTNGQSKGREKKSIEFHLRSILHTVWNSSYYF